MSNSNQDLETVVNALLKAVKQQPPIKTEVKRPTWVERRFGVPKSGEEVLWRLTWLIAIPAIATLCYLPIADWCWFNGLPWLTILVSVSILLIYWAMAQLAIQSAGNLERLVEIQVCIPVAVVFFILMWETLAHGT